MAGQSNVERAKFEKAALPHMQAAYNLAFWLVRNSADADDVVQDAYLRAFRAYVTLTGDDIKPWLLTIVRNVAYRALSRRSRGRNVISFEDAFPSRTDDATNEPNVAADQVSAEELLIGVGERNMVHAALAELAPTFREVVILRELEELSYRQIAVVTGVPIGTVMSRLSRARIELKAILARLIEKDEKNAM